MTNKKYFFLLCFLACTFAVSAQQPGERRAGELLVQLRADAGIPTVLTTLSRAAGTPVSVKYLPAPDWHIYLLEFDETKADTRSLMQKARSMSDLESAQWNGRTEERKTPNDEYWSQQDNMAQIGMPGAWEVSTGGLTPNGDTIVVAVLEKGALRNHPDLIANMWYNRHETPGNGIDDDGNGYVDDYRGWNPSTKNDDPGDPAFHGTAVNGIVGATGNNGTGVTGINWNVKLMNLADVEYEDEIIAGYQYVAATRRLYNKTQGAKGAFVVSTNASFGFDFWRAEDHPIWCAVYDSLGAVGILSAAATANKNVNVDTQGDMPTSCTSDYLITVTAVDKFDKKITSTGYGIKSIDLGAPGLAVYTTYSESQKATYSTFTGTSAATPHISGAIGLLYSLNCPDFTADALDNPVACARRVRSVLLEHTSPVASLDSITTTGGRLDVLASVNAVQDLCDGAVTGPLEILSIVPNPVQYELHVNFQTPTYKPYTIRVFDMLGRLIKEESWEPDPFIPNEWTFDATFLPRGVYVVAIGRNDAVRAQKFVKK